MKLALPTALLVVAGALVAADVANACSCAPLTKESFQRADAAVVARLDEVTRHPLRGSTNYGPAEFEYTIRRVFKAQPRLEEGDTLVIDSHTSSSACGMPGREGDRVAFFAHRHREEWRSSLCASTSPERMRRLAKRGDRAGKSRLTAAGPGECPWQRASGRLGDRRRGLLEHQLAVGGVDPHGVAV